MTNPQTQAWLDRKKCVASRETEKDLSGCMYYCQLCEHKEYTICKVTHEDRVKHNYCATAYNRFNRKTKQKGGSR